MDRVFALRHETLAPILRLEPSSEQQRHRVLLSGYVAADALGSLLPFLGGQNDDRWRDAIGTYLDFDVAIRRLERGLGFRQTPGSSHAKHGLQVDHVGHLRKFR